MKDNIEALTGLRGYAALWVMVFHSWWVISPLYGIPNAMEKLSKWLHFDLSPFLTAWSGVEIFFILTGFLLFWPFAKSIQCQGPVISLTEYFKHRFFRIVPAYWFQLLMLLLLSYIGLYEHIRLKDFLAHLFFVNNFSHTYAGSINSVYWTLPIEVDFYIMLPIFAWIISRIGMTWFFMVTIITVNAYKIWIFPHYAHDPMSYGNWLFSQMFGRMDLFVFGMLIAWLYNDLKEEFSNKAYYFIIMCPTLYFMPYFAQLLQYKMGWTNIFKLYALNTVYANLCCYLICSLITNNKLGNLLFANPVAVFLGEISYSLYLWHLPLLTVIFKRPHIVYMLEHDHKFLLQVIVCYILITLLVSTASYKLIEKPFMKRKTVWKFQKR